MGIKIGDLVITTENIIFKVDDIDYYDEETIYLEGALYPLYKQRFYVNINEIEYRLPNNQEKLAQAKKYIDTKKEYVYCCHCHTMHEKDRTFTYKSKHYCFYCKDTFFAQCDICGEFYPRTDMIDVGELDVDDIAIDSRQHYCEKCFEKIKDKEVVFCKYHKIYEEKCDKYPMKDGICYVGREELARKERLELLDKIIVKEGGDL